MIVLTQSTVDGWVRALRVALQEVANHAGHGCPVQAMAIGAVNALIGVCSDAGIPPQAVFGPNGEHFPRALLDRLPEPYRELFRGVLGIPDDVPDDGPAPMTAGEVSATDMDALIARLTGTDGPTDGGPQG